MMDISNFAVKPALVDITIDDETIVKTYGSTITFKMYDHIDLNTYFLFYRAQQSNDGSEINQALQKIIFKADGTPALNEGEQFPPDITIEAVIQISKNLGKSKHQATLISTSETTVD